MTMRVKHYRNFAALPYFYAPHHHFAFLISNFSFKRGFQTQSKGGTPRGLTLSGSLHSPSSPRGEGFVRRYSFSTYACIRFDDAGIAAFSFRSLPHWGRLCREKRYSRFFIRPTQKRPSLTSGRFYVYYLLRETLIKSQNSISHVFSCNASSYSSLNSSLFASEYSLHCMKI